MPVPWTQAQQQLLANLKSHLEAQERLASPTGAPIGEYVAKSGARSKSPSPLKATRSRRYAPSEDLFRRLSSGPEGIRFDIDGHWNHALFGPSDHVVFLEAVSLGSGPRKVAFGLPRVPVGVSSWLALAAMIQLMVLAAQRNPTDATIADTRNSWVVIASRERSVRDLYLSQHVVFGRCAVSTTDLPIHRLRRDGGLSPLSLAQHNDLSCPVLFYHYDTVERPRPVPREVLARLVLAELSEIDSRLSEVLLERLEHVRVHVGDPKTCLFFNSFDQRVRSRLESSGYSIVDLRPRTSIDLTQPAIPTIEGSYSRYHCPQIIVPKVVDDEHDLSGALTECARGLASLSEQVQSPDSRAVLGKWWSMWRTMKDLAIPLETYERYRMHAQGRGTLDTAIDRVALSADRIQDSDARLVRAVAPSIGQRLRQVYRCLEQSCPKAEQLMCMLGQENGAACISQRMYVLGEKAQVDALAELLLLSHGKVVGQDISIAHLSRATTLARSMLAADCVLPGVWDPWHNATVVALGAEQVTVLMYPYEAGLLETRLREHNALCAQLGRTLAGGGTYAPLLDVTEAMMRDLLTLKQANKLDIEPRDQPPWLGADTPIDVDEPEPQDQNLCEEHLAGNLIIVFDDDTHVIARPHSEMMRISDDTVECVFASCLSEGDTVALISSDVSRSVFESVLAKVNHMVRVDRAVVDLWRQAIRRIAPASSMGRFRTEADVIRELQHLGCEKSNTAVRHWLRGTTMAPQDVADVRRMLQIASVPKPSDVAAIVSREMGVIRTFNRRLGKRLKAQMMMQVLGRVATQPLDRLDFEIDEAIEAVEKKVVVSIKVAGG